MSAIANPRPSSRLTRAERMAAYYAEQPRVAAARFKLGDSVIFERRTGRIIDTPRPGIVIVKTYAGEHMVGESHPSLEAVEA